MNITEKAVNNSKMGTIFSNTAFTSNLRKYFSDISEQICIQSISFTWSLLGKYWIKNPRRHPANIPITTSKTPLRTLKTVDPENTLKKNLKAKLQVQRNNQLYPTTINTMHLQLRGTATAVAYFSHSEMCLI